MVVNGNPVWVADGKEKAVDYGATLEQISSLNSESAGRRNELKALKAEIETLKSNAPDENEVIKELQKQLGEKEAENQRLASQFNEAKLSEAFSNSAFIKENIAVPLDMIRTTFGSRFSIEDSVKQLSFSDFKLSGYERGYYAMKDAKTAYIVTRAELEIDYDTLYDILD